MEDLAGASARSNGVLRDYDLIDELSRLTYVNITATVTCMDEGIREKMEPGGVTSQRRLDMLRQLGRTNASTGLRLMPVVPYLTDSYDNIDHLFAGAADSEVDYVLPG